MFNLNQILSRLYHSTLQTLYSSKQSVINDKGRGTLLEMKETNKKWNKGATHDPLFGAYIKKRKKKRKAVTVTWRPLHKCEYGLYIWRSTTKTMEKALGVPTVPWLYRRMFSFKQYTYWVFKGKHYEVHHIQGCPTFWRLCATLEEELFLGHTWSTLWHVSTKKSHNVLSKFTMLCWAAFIAILGCMQPAGRRLDTPGWLTKYKCVQRLREQRGKSVHTAVWVKAQDVYTSLPTYPLVLNFSK